MLIFNKHEIIPLELSSSAHKVVITTNPIFQHRLIKYIYHIVTAILWHRQSDYLLIFNIN